MSGSVRLPPYINSYIARGHVHNNEQCKLMGDGLCLTIYVCDLLLRRFYGNMFCDIKYTPSVWRTSLWSPWKMKKTRSSEALVRTSILYQFSWCCIPEYWNLYKHRSRTSNLEYLMPLPLFWRLKRGDYNHELIRNGAIGVERRPYCSARRLGPIPKFLLPPPSIKTKLCNITYFYFFSQQRSTISGWRSGKRDFFCHNVPRLLVVWLT
jgi:hypothetical protein